MLAQDTRPPVLRNRDPIAVARDALIAGLAGIRPLPVRHAGFSADELQGAYDALHDAAVRFDALVAAVVTDLQDHGLRIAERTRDCTYTVAGVDEVLFQPVADKVDDLRDEDAALGVPAW